MDKRLKILFALILFLSFSFNKAAAEEALTWHDCLKEAAANHPDLIAAQENIKQSQASKKITASALFPQVNSNLGASTAKTTAGGTSDTYSYGLTGTQLLFDASKTGDKVKAAQENIKAAEENFRFTSSAVRFRLRSAFIDLLKAQELLSITNEIYKIRRENLELITLRYLSGLEHKGALLTAEANLAAAKYDISRAKRSVEVAQRELAKEMGRRQLTPIEVKGDFEVKDAAKEKPDLEALAQNNSSLQQIIAQKNAAEFSLKSTYANFYPVASAQAGASKTGSDLPPEKDQWNLGLSVTMPVFEGGLRSAQVSQARASLNQLAANEKSTKDAIALTLEQKWAGLQDALDNLGVQGKSLLASEERSKVAEAQYSTGFISFDNWTIIEDNLVRAKKDFLDAQVNTLLAEAGWVQAKGETLEYEK